MIDSLFSIGYSIQLLTLINRSIYMGKKSKTLMKAAALAGAAYLASKHMGAGKKEKTPIKDYSNKKPQNKLQEAGDRNPNMPSITEDTYSYKENHCLRWRNCLKR
jgi:hypothetical protein